MAGKYTAETQPYKAPGAGSQSAREASTSAMTGKPQRASYTPVGGPVPTATAMAYGKDGGKASFQDPPSVVVGGASVAQDPPGLPGTFTIGQDKNVSTPVTG